MGGIPCYLLIPVRCGIDRVSDKTDQCYLFGLIQVGASRSRGMRQRQDFPFSGSRRKPAAARWKTVRNILRVRWAGQNSLFQSAGPAGFQLDGRSSLAGSGAAGYRWEGGAWQAEFGSMAMSAWNSSGRMPGSWVQETRLSQGSIVPLLPQGHHWSMRQTKQHFLLTTVFTVDNCRCIERQL